MARRAIKDDYGVVVTPGSVIVFGYGIPGRRVEADVIERDGKLIALTPGHNPPECAVHLLRKHVGSFWIKQTDAEQ